MRRRKVYGPILFSAVALIFTSNARRFPACTQVCREGSFTHETPHTTKGTSGHLSCRNESRGLQTHQISCFLVFKLPVGLQIFLQLAPWPGTSWLAPRRR